MAIGVEDIGNVAEVARVEVVHNGAEKVALHLFIVVGVEVGIQLRVDISLGTLGVIDARAVGLGNGRGSQSQSGGKCEGNLGRHLEVGWSRKEGNDGYLYSLANRSSSSVVAQLTVRIF